MPRPKLDPKVTEAISDWLNTPADSRDVRAGAELLLTLNRNRAIYNAAVRRPAQLASKIEHELRKYLNIRLHDAAVSDLRRVESEVMPQVSMTLDETMYAGQIDPARTMPPPRPRLPARRHPRPLRQQRRALPPHGAALQRAQGHVRHAAVRPP